MAIGVVFEFPGVTQAKYEEVVDQFMGRGRQFNKLADWPVKGVLMHIAGPMQGGWRVVDVWESEESFRRFGEVLMPMAAKIGFPMTEPKIFPLFKFIKD
jgi:hypothetical protein